MGTESPEPMMDPNATSSSTSTKQSTDPLPPTTVGNDTMNSKGSNLTITNNAKEIRNELKLEQLFNHSWFWKNDGNDVTRFGILFLYAPIGLLLVIIRTFMALQFLLLKAIMPNSPMKLNAMRVMGTVLGVTISTEGEPVSLATDPSSNSYTTFVSNAVTVIDHFVLYVLTNSSYVKSEMTSLPSPLVKLFQMFDGMLKKKDISKHTTVYYPERATTNGTVGLLEFVDKFLIAEKVQPVGIIVNRPFVNVNTVQSGILSELFFLFFVPYTHFHVKFLPPEVYDEVTTPKTIAAAINCIPTKHKATDKSEYIKKLNYRPPSLAAMARSVQQQLHPVILSPESIIAALQKTGSVEKAIEELKKSFTEPSFSKSASQRMMSFQEKKRLMIAAARQKYCEKNGLEF